MTLWIGCILAAMALEALALVVFHRRTGRGPPAASVLPNIAAGAMLLVGMRLALAGTSWGWISLCLLLSLAAHLADLRQRWTPGAPH